MSLPVLDHELSLTSWFVHACSFLGGRVKDDFGDQLDVERFNCGMMRLLRGTSSVTCDVCDAYYPYRMRRTLASCLRN